MARPRIPQLAQVGALLALAALAGACGRDQAAPDDAPAATSADGDTLYLGVTTVSTGALSDTAVLGGVRLAVERLNAERPAGAPPVGARPAPVRAGQERSEVAAAAALRDDPQVVAVVGPTGSAAALDVAPVFGDVEGGGARAVPALAPTATNPAVGRASPWLFRVCPSDDDAAAAVARFAADSLGVRRLAVVFRNDLFGRGFTQRVAPELARRGVAVTERDPYLAGATRYEAYAERIARGGVEALLVAGNADDAATFVRAVHAAGARPVVIGTDDVAGVVGTFAGDPALRGLRFVTFFAAWAPGARLTPAAAAFDAAYRARYGRTPDHRAALSYDAALLAGRALYAELGRAGGRATSVRATSVRAPSRVGAPADGGIYALRHRLRDALAAVGRGAPAFEGVTGAVRFDPRRPGDNGAVGRPVWIGAVGS